MKTKIFFLLGTLLCVSCYGQVSFSIGAKLALAHFNEVGGLNQVGGFLIETANYGNKPMGQIYGRIRYGKFYLQPEVRYSLSRFYPRYENIDRENPNWDYYNGIGYQSLAADIHRLDVPIKVGYFILPNISLNVGVINTFYSYKDKPFSFMDKGRFFIGDDVFNSLRGYNLGGIAGLSFHANNFTLGFDYDIAFRSLHNPVQFSGSRYDFNRKTQLYTFSVGYGITKTYRKYK